ncbi:MAG: hypothetical protein ABSB33_05640 [Tepidisphaeraceae bacterium]
MGRIGLGGGHGGIVICHWSFVIGHWNSTRAFQFSAERKETAKAAKTAAEQYRGEIEPPRRQDAKEDAENTMRELAKIHPLEPDLNQWADFVLCLRLGVLASWRFNLDLHFFAVTFIAVRGEN